MGREGAQVRQGFEGVGPGGFGQGVGGDAAQLGDVVGDAGQLGGGVAALGVAGGAAGGGGVEPMQRDRKSVV